MSIDTTQYTQLLEEYTTNILPNLRYTNLPSTLFDLLDNTESLYIELLDLCSTYTLQKITTSGPDLNTLEKVLSLCTELLSSVKTIKDELITLYQNCRIRSIFNFTEGNATSESHTYLTYSIAPTNTIVINTVDINESPIICPEIPQMTWPDGKRVQLSSDWVGLGTQYATCTIVPTSYSGQEVIGIVYLMTGKSDFISPHAIPLVWSTGYDWTDFEALQLAMTTALATALPQSAASAVTYFNDLISLISDIIELEGALNIELSESIDEAEISSITKVLTLLDKWKTDIKLQISNTTSLYPAIRTS